MNVAMKEFFDQQLIPYHYSSCCCSCWGDPVWESRRLLQIRL